MRRRGLLFLTGLVGAVALSGPAAAQSARERVVLIVGQARASMQIDPATAAIKARLAERESELISDPATRGTMRATALWLEGEAASRLRDLAGATPKLAEALALVRTHAPGSKLEGDLLISIGTVHSDTGKVVEALREFQRAHAILLRLKDTRTQAVALICIASMYGDAKDYVGALKYFDQALATIGADPGVAVSIQNNRAAALRDSGRYAEAERGYKAALTIAETLHSEVVAAQVLRGYARLQLKQRDVAGAARTVRRGLALSKGLDAFNQQAMLAVAAQVALQQGDRKAAASLVARSFAGVDLTATAFSFRDAHETAYQVYHAMGLDRLAYAHLLARCATL